MAKWNGKSVNAIELVDAPENLPEYAQKLAGQIVHEIGIHFYSSGLPRFTCGQHRTENGYHMMFDEVHVKQFIYESDILLNIDVDCDCSVDSWKPGPHHESTCWIYKA